MNVEQPQLHSVKAIKPHYSRTHSLQSSAATNEYFSDYASDASSAKSHNTTASYETPPSRISTPLLQQPQIDSEMTLPARPGAARPAPLHTTENVAERSRMLRSFDNMSPPTPGTDDTPYVRFAIEQLTRDEDVMGHGRHGSLISNDMPTIRPIPELEETSDDSASFIHQPTEERPPTPPLPPQRPISRRPVPEEILVPVHPPEGQVWAELGHMPLPLRTLSLSLYILICLLMIAGLLFSNVYALRGHGLINYDGNATPRYFVFQYLPQLLGIVLIIWLFVVEAAIYRVMPYLSMSEPGARHTLLQDHQIIPSNFLLPDLHWFKCREHALGVCSVIFWITNMTVPLLSCLYQTQWISNDGPARWRWTTVQGSGWTLFALYVLLISALVYCLFRFRNRESALMWDPVSLADIIVLFQRCNICPDFERTEVSRTVDELPPRSLRLGYWTTSHKPEIFYGVGEEHASVKRLSQDLQPPMLEKNNSSQDSSFDMERQRYSYASSFTRNIHSPFVRYRWVPWFLRDSAVVAWIIAAVLLIIAFLVVSFVNRAVKDGFQPLLPSRPGSGGFSSSNFLYSFLPTLLGMVLFLAWQPVDTYFRAVQPFANLSNPTGASAERTLLASYNACLPGEVTIQALVNRDFKVAYVSFIGLISAMLPILAGGVFTAQLFSSNNEVRMVASMPGYIALSVFATIYALSFLIIWPRRKRYLPHGINTIADLMSFLYASPLLSEGAILNVRTKADLVARLVGAPLGLTGDSRVRGPTARYAFGIYIGRDGKEHLGIDRLQRPGSGEMLIVTGK